MPQPPQPLRRLRDSLLLVASSLSVAALGPLSLGCTSAAQARAQCELDAVRALPLDEPEQITAGDAIALGRRLKACQAPAPAASPPTADAGG